MIHSTVLVSAVAQWLTVIIGEGATDAAKQLFLYNTLVDVNFILLFLYLVIWLSQSRSHVTRILKHQEL